MAKTKKQKTFRWVAYKPLLATALAFAGVFNMMSTVLAEGTPANTPIENTATATYSDGTTNFDAVSNTVTINVAEVAGITVTSTDFNDPNGGSIVTDDVVTFDFTVTNTGNADTHVFVPGLNGITPQEGTILRVDIVNPAIPTTAAEAVNPAPQPAASFVEVPAAGADSNTLAGFPNGGVIPPDGSFVVRVTVDVDADAVGEQVGVQFGNTLDNTTAPADGTQNQQNIPDLSDTAANITDVRTVNIGGTDAPVNGEREAAAFRQEAFATATTNLAQALLLKSSTVSDVTPATPADPSDNLITYGLELRIGNASFPGVDPGRLENTSITLDGIANTQRVLISDAIPANTVFNPATPPTAPAGWTVVYSTDPVAPGGNPLQVNWVSVPPAPASIRRIGFIYDSAASGVLAPTTVVTGFGFTVTTNGLTAPGGSIANIAQVFGETEGDTGNNIVYDESGDQQPNNLNDGATPTNNTTTFDPANDLGVANVADPDPGNNQGTGNDGESTVDTINAVPPAVGDIFNGPNNTPTATGPVDTDDDFTNVATTVPIVGAPGSTGDPALSPVITNELLNPAGAPTNLDTVTLLPLAPSAADAVPGTGGNYGADNTIPNGTIVTISFGAQTVQYEYTAGNANPFHTVGDNTTIPNPVVVGTLVPGTPRDYTVTIDLPAGTAQVQGYGIPIAAFVDNDANGAFTPGTETVSNITVNRVYTGFMQLVKRARVVYAERDGVTLPPSAFLDTAGLAALTPTIRPGDNLEYQITYTNISEAPPVGGGGNVVLNANNFILTEDGNAVIPGGIGTNNWAGITLHQLGTAASTGTIQYFNGGTSLGTTEPAAETDPNVASAVTIYRNSIGTVAPQGTGTLNFVRRVR